MDEQNKAGKEAIKLKNIMFEIYDKKYKLLLLIPFIMLLLASAQISYQFYKTGDFIKKDVSLKGGVSVTIPIKEEVDIKQIENGISYQFPKNDISVRELKGAGSIVGILIQADIEPNDKSQVDSLLKSIEALLRIDINKVNYSIEITGSSLGKSFFKEFLIALFIAFVFMALVVFIYFRTFIPSIAVILAAFSDMIIALSVINLLDIRIGTAGIAAFLMLIGYSVDTDILLTVRVLKRKEGTVMDRIISSMKTGMTETIAAITTVGVALLVTQSEIIREIMLILLIGLFADIFNTWIQNVGLLRMYIEKKAKKGVII